MTTFDPRTVHSVHAQQFGTPRAAQFSTQGFPGQEFPGPVPPPPGRPSRKRPLAAKIVTGMVAASLLVGGAGTWMALSGSPTEVAVQATSFAGDNPTTNPFGADAPQVAQVAATGQQTGDTPSMYAATTPPSCSNADFLSQLQADPNKLAAFGGVFGIGASDVPAFVKSLSPVVLRAATSVTDHPFTDGAFVEQRAVLAAGTAVLVNSYGEPTVKCFNGNPLTAGAPAPEAVTVAPTATALAQFHFTTIDNSRPVVVTTPPDPKPIPGPNPPPLTGRYNYDGSIMLSDGRIELPDGKILTPKATIPEGGFKNPDGSVTVNGKVFNPDGTERLPIKLAAQTIGVDGIVRNLAGVPVTPQPTIIWNYDGTATRIEGNRVIVRNGDGTLKSSVIVNPPDTIGKDGSIRKPNGEILNPDGKTKRTPVDLPDQSTVTPNQGAFAANKTNINGKSLLNKDGSLPAGAIKNPDGSIKLPNGTVLNHDGTVKTPKALPDGSVLTPGGVIPDPARIPTCTGVIPDDSCATRHDPVVTPSTGGEGTATGGTGSTSTGSGSASTGSSSSSSSSTSSSSTSSSQTSGSEGGK